ncbi:Nucleoside-diphosphate-sugar epimerase [Variovorax sp. HW608]|uniref:NAD-dependent epimerase/dehydratase family protein n=1 Tax=Variovorax sp. HW608 TaxID=1034889 RepID=UPI00081FBB92|nr:NAD-dependent epimerase/dehydratase family protein [Variovorax sp. HW608]SCK29883.1 Nucleoside-diphosphate-sugar epimerase [Variovorax sp. HW608]
MKQVLITGGGGFLAAWIARRLAARGTRLRLFDVPGAPRTASDIVLPRHASQLDWRQGDIRSADDVRAAMEGCDAVIHLAGVLTPACSANPVRGAEINLIGSLHVFDAARAQGLSKVVYASSAGVYGPAHSRHPEPATHYGAFKLAVEGAARAYWNEHRIASTGFRPFVIYGPGRETGVSAGPSLACRAAVRGIPYTIGFTGACGLVYVDDVAEAFENALFAPAEGAKVFNLVGELHTIDAVIAEIRRQVPDADLRAEGPPLTIAADVTEEGPDELLAAGRRSTLAEGIAATLTHYRSLEESA